jgi:two-component system OmpR family sensor kinase
VATIDSQDGQQRWRVRAVTPDVGDQTILFAVSLADTDATVSRLARLSLIVSALVLLGTAAAAWLIAGLGLRPLESIEENFEKIAQGDLTQRVPDFPPRTEVGRLARSLNGMLGQIEQAFKARAESETTLRRFVSDASHELRTPVAAIRGHAEMWRNGVTTDLDTAMARIEAESTRMGDLVDDLLLLARLDQDRPLEHEPVDLLSLATDAVIDARALQPDRAITLHAQPGLDPPLVIGDEARLRQILANLVNNAITHTPDSATVEIRLATTPAHVTVSVTDTGSGFPPEVLSKVFDRFYRADPGRARDHGGSGLGLAIVKSLTEAHGGSVTCTSTCGEGTTFTVTLPLASPLS